jgi:cytochrome P450
MCLFFCWLVSKERFGGTGSISWLTFPTGYDTTANTILFCCIMLALYSDVQDQIIEEADRIRKEAREAGREELSYTEDLPKFRYLIAFMVSGRQYPNSQIDHHVDNINSTR